MAGSVESPLMMAGLQQDSQARLHAGDAAPHAKEIGVALQVGRTRRMVGGDHVDIAIQHVLPQGVAVGGGPQGRRALGDRAQADHVFFGEEQVVRASLDGEIGAAGARFERRRNSAPRTDMHDVQPGARFARQQGGALDGLDLGQHRARRQKGADIAAASFADAAREAAGDLLAFGVDRHGQSARGGDAHAFIERQVVRARKLGEAGVAEESFEADHAAFGEFLQTDRDCPERCRPTGRSR